jgi:hypothetical protein
VTRRWFWVALAAVVVSLVIAGAALNDVLMDCNYVGLGLGRPSCEAGMSDRYLTLALSLVVLAVAFVSAIFLRPKRRKSDR